VPATDAVILSKNQNWLLALESKYLLPLLKRPDFPAQSHSHAHHDSDAPRALITPGGGEVSRRQTGSRMQWGGGRGRDVAEGVRGQGHVVSKHRWHRICV
jgi:hypothetical protein